MATLELSMQDEVSTPVRRKRRLGLLFWIATLWLAVILVLAVLAPLLPLQTQST